MSILRFRVISFSSEEPSYPADELNVHSPTTKGWKSVKFCDYPQELGFEFLGGDVKLTQVQILSHQALISSKIEVYIGSGSSYHSARFVKLGFLTLDTNEKAAFQARELKTVHVNQSGQFMKFVLHKNYMNKINTCNQVGIVAVNFLGQEEESDPGYIAEPADRNPPRMATNTLNDLAVDMNLDGQTAAKLRLLAEAKQRAIASEDYLTAKEIKAVESELKLLGARLAQLDIAKRDAVNAEDYDRAKDIKDDCDAIRGEIEKKVKSARIPGVTDSRIAQSSRMAPSRSPMRVIEENSGDPFETAPPKKPPAGIIDVDSIVVGGRSKSVPEDEYASPRAVPTMRGGGGAGRKAAVEDDDSDVPIIDRPIKYNSAAGPYKDGGPDEYEDAAAPASQFPPGQHPLEGVPNLETLPSPKELSVLAKDQAEQTGIMALFGEYRTKCLYSVAWVLREAMLVKAQQMMVGQFLDNPGLPACLGALLATVRVGVDEKMPQVFFSALSLLEGILLAAKRAKIGRSTVAPLVDQILHTLAEKMSDSNARIREGARKGMDLLSSSSCVGPVVVANHSLTPIPAKQKAVWRPLLNRLVLLADIVNKFGVGGSSGIHIDPIMNFMKNNGAFIHSNGDVREAAKALTVAAQRYVGTEVVLPFLQELRPQQLNEYKAAFESAAGAGGDAEGSHAPAAAAAAPAGKKASSGGDKAQAKGAAHDHGSHGSPPKKADSSSHGKGNPPQQASHAAQQSPGDSKDAGAEDFYCNFCGAGSPSWNEDELDMHYLKDCPLLAPCPACSQVLEIAALPDHLLDECDHRADYVACDVTGLAIKVEEEASWKAGPHYVTPPENCFYCPLCLVAVEDSNDAWKDHLVHVCPQNAALMKGRK